MIDTYLGKPVEINEHGNNAAVHKRIISGWKVGDYI